MKLETLNNDIMKKILIAFVILAGMLTSCYDEFRLDYDYTSVAFSTATGGSGDLSVLHRTVVIGEGLELEFGCYLSGLIENDREWWADFTIDESLLAGTSYTLMPSDMYTLSNNSRFEIPKGDFIGTVSISLDSAAFVNDPLAAEPNYAIPFRLTSTSADSISTTQSTKILVIKYMNHYEGSYYHTGTFTTYDDGGAVIRSGGIDNVIEATTLELDTVRMNGTVYSTGADYIMHAAVRSDNTVYLEKIPNPDVITDPYNLAFEAALTTDYVSGWENLEGVRDGLEPTSSTDRTGPIYGNWNSANQWRYLQYDFPGARTVSSTEIYWFTDGGGLLFPDESKVEYWDIDQEAWVEVPNVVGLGHEADQWNITTFDPVVTDKIRYSFINYSQSCGVIEWKVLGLPKALYPEQSTMDTVTPIGDCIWDDENSKFILNYRVDYVGESYYTEVSVELEWRNRIRDGVNEWWR